MPASVEYAGYIGMIAVKLQKSMVAKCFASKSSLATSALFCVLLSSTSVSASPLKCSTELKSTWGVEFEVLTCRVVEDVARIEAYQINRGHCGPPSFTYPILKDWRMLSKMTSSEKVSLRSLVENLKGLIDAKGKRYSSFNTQIEISAMTDDYIQSGLSNLYGYPLENGQTIGSYLTTSLESATLQTLDDINRAAKEEVIGKFSFGDTVSIKFPAGCDPLEVKFFIDDNSYVWTNF